MIKIKISRKEADFNVGSSCLFSASKNTAGPATMLDTMEFIKSAVDIIAKANNIYFNKNILTK